MMEKLHEKVSHSAGKATSLSAKCEPFLQIAKANQCLWMCTELQCIHKSNAIAGYFATKNWNEKITDENELLFAMIHKLRHLLLEETSPPPPTASL